MTTSAAGDTLEAFGLAFATRPRPHAYRRRADGSWIALAALEIERFVIVSQPTRPHHELWEAAWTGVVDALSHVEEPLEFWYALLTSRPPGGLGPSLRTGWLAVGRGATPDEAGALAARTLDALRAIHTAHLGFATLRSVTEAHRLVDFVRLLEARRVVSFRRARWAPATRASLGTASKRQCPSTLLAWQPASLPWSPLADSLAAMPVHAAFVVRALTALTPGAPELAAAENDIVEVATELESLRSSRVDRVTVTALLPALDQLRHAAEERLSTLRGRCFALDASLACHGEIPPALAAMAAAGLVAPAQLPARGDAASRGHSPELPSTPILRVELPGGALWAPLHATPDVLAGPREATALLRTVEPPLDEGTPLPCARSRSLPVSVTPTSGTLIGDAERFGESREVRLPESARFQHVYMVGQTGTGKSTLMLNMILDDVRNGHGVTVLDPHGPLIADVLERIPPERQDDVVFLDLSDTEHAVGLNPLDLRAQDGASYAALRDRVIDELLDTFDALYDLRETGGPMFEQYFRSFITLVVGGQRPSDYTPTLPMIELAMAQRGLVSPLVGRLRSEDPGIATRLDAMFASSGDHSFSNFVPYVNSKMIRFYAHAQARRILCQTRCLDFDRVLGERKVLLIELSKPRLGSEAAALIARQIILRLTVAAMTRSLSGAVPHFLYVDEFHNFATERFAQLLAEARKFRLGLVLAHQYTSQLVKGPDRRVLDSVLGNVATFVAFRVGAVDAALLEGVMAPRASAADIYGLPNYSACVRSVGGLGNVPFTLRTRPADPHFTFATQSMRRRSRERDARPREVIDREIVENLRAFSAVSGPDEARRILRCVNTGD